MPPMHERRTSSQSMQNDMNMNRGYSMQGAGRGRGFPQQPQFGGAPGGMSPGANYRQMQGQQGPRPNMPQQFQQPPMPSSPYMRTGSPAVNHQRPNMPYGYPSQQQVNTLIPLAHPTANVHGRRRLSKHVSARPPTLWTVLCSTAPTLRLRQTAITPTNNI